MHFGPLEAFSAFPVEFFFSQMKRRLCSGRTPPAQVAKRLAELEQSLLEDILWYCRSTIVLWAYELSKSPRMLKAVQFFNLLLNVSQRLLQITVDFYNATISLVVNCDRMIASLV